MIWKKQVFDMSTLYDVTNYDYNGVNWRNKVTTQSNTLSVKVDTPNGIKGTIEFKNTGVESNGLQFTTTTPGYLRLYHDSFTYILNDNKFYITPGTYRVVINTRKANPSVYHGVEITSFELYKIVDNLTDGFSICLGDNYNIAECYYSMDDYGLAISNTDYIGTPVTDVYMVDIPGGGQLDLSTALTGEPVYKSRDINLEVGFTKPANKSFKTFVSDLRNKWHGQRVCISFDDDSEWYYVGRLSIEDFESTRDLAKFNIKIVCDPYKYKIVPIIFKYSEVETLTDDTSWGGIKRVPITHNQTYTQDVIDEITGWLDSDSTPPQEILDIADFNGDNRITQSDLNICLLLKDSVLLPLHHTHTPVEFIRGDMMLSEEITYKTTDGTETHSLKTEDTIFQSSRILNQNYEVVLIKNDGTTVTYQIKNDLATLPNLFSDQAFDRGHGVNAKYLGIIIRVINRRTGYKERRRIIFDGIVATVLSNVTTINKNVSIRIRERSL